MIQHHGGNIYGYADILDFSANINPLGMPESVKQAIAAGIDDIGCYPDPYCTELRKKLAVREGVSAESIVCGNGADDIIFRIAHAFRPRKALICAPSFTEYSRALAETGCEVAEYQLSRENGFAVTDEFISVINSSYDICFVCTPNNPTGRLITPEILQALAQKCSENGIILVCDECFLDFVAESEKYSLRNFLNGNSVILKAFTKVYAMPGIRLGYAVCGDKGIAEKIQQNGQFWSVSSLAQTAGIAALDEEKYVRETQDYVAAQRQYLAAELNSLSVKVYSGAANFLLFRSILGLCEKLLANGILIRDCSNFSGLSDGYYRIAVRTHDENIRLVDALRRCMNG